MPMPRMIRSTWQTRRVTIRLADLWAMTFIRIYRGIIEINGRPQAISSLAINGFLQSLQASFSHHRPSFRCHLMIDSPVVGALVPPFQSVPRRRAEAIISQNLFFRDGLLF